MICKLRRYISEGLTNNITTFTCHEVRDCIEGWKKEFRDKNATDLIQLRRPDRAYEAFCKELDDFLAQCKCPKPSIEEKIQLAKEKREAGQSAWKSKAQNY
jgi:hypothetical protein